MEYIDNVQNKKISPNLLVAIRLFISYALFPTVTILLLTVVDELMKHLGFGSALLIILALIVLVFYLFVFSILNVLLLSQVNFEVTNNFKVLNIIFILLLFFTGFFVFVYYKRGIKELLIYYPLAAVLLYSSVITFFLLKVRKNDKAIAMSDGSELTTNAFFDPSKKVVVEDNQFKKSMLIGSLSIGFSFILILYIAQLYTFPLIVSIISWILAIVILVIQFPVYKIRYGDTYKRHLIFVGVAYFLVNIYVTLVLAKVLPFVIESPKDSPWFLFLTILFSTIPLMRLYRRSELEIN